MKQVIQDVRTGKTQVLEVPVPGARPGTVLVRTEASLVSAGTERTLVSFANQSLLGKARSRPDLVRQTLNKLQREGLGATLDAVQGRLNQPIPLGYSSAGRVAQVGEGVSGFQVGEAVACAGGGYAVHADYAVVPTNLIARVPENVSFEEAASATLGAIALHAFRLGELQVGEQVAVVGLGLLGQLVMQIARAAGCHAFGLDTDAERVGLATRLGLTAVLREGAAEAAQAQTDARGFDAVLICADTAESDPIEIAGEIARDRGRVVVVGAVGMQIPRRTYYEKELSLIVSRSYGPGRYDPAYEEAGQDYPYGYVRWTEGRNLQAYLDLLASGAVDFRSLISHRIPIERAEEAYQLLRGERKESYLAVLLRYPEGDPALPEAGRIVLQTAKAGASGPVRLGALGAGNFAVSVAFPILRKLPGVELVGLATASGASAATAGRRYGFRYAAADEKDLLQDPDINTVAVFTRHGDHPRQVSLALKAGKHVFCEKPLAVDRTGLDQVIQTLSASNHLLTAGFNRRFAPHTALLKRFLEPVSEPLVVSARVNAGRLPREHWVQDPEQGGGRIIAEGIHFIDLMIYLVGAVPTEVQAAGVADRERDLEEDVVITLWFNNGSIGTLAYLAGGDPGLGKERLEIFGGGRSAALEDFRRLELVTRGRRTVHRARWRQNKGHRELWQAFVAAVAKGGPPPIPYGQLIASHLASFAAVESLRTSARIAVETVAQSLTSESDSGTSPGEANGLAERTVLPDPQPSEE